MITWMQRHNRYLVWTIWIATIAFIGAGFVGWGSYKYGSKASAVGAVGDIEISNARLNLTYRNLYDRYTEIYQGKFDEAQAKKMGLIQQAFRSLATQAQLLNLAREYGIVVSEKELADYIAGMKGFQENGVFNKTVYTTYLQNRRIKSSTFESILRDELIIQKLLGLLEHPAVGLETQTVAAALSITDKIGYRVLSRDAMPVALTDAMIRTAWETNRDQYMTPRAYELALVWTDTQGISVDDNAVKDFYDKNSFNYVDANGTQLNFEHAKAAATKDLRVKKGKKQALLDYIAFKKGKKSSSETQTLPVNDPRLPKAMWHAIIQSDAGTILKPKIIGSRYVTVKVIRAVAPKPMPFAQAKPQVVQQLKRIKSLELMDKKSKEILARIDQEKLTISDEIGLTKIALLPPLNRAESLQFIQKLFTISAKNGIISLPKHMVVYKILEHRVRPVDHNATLNVQNETDTIKKSVFENALFKKLNEQFPVKAYAKGL